MEPDGLSGRKRKSFPSEGKGREPRTDSALFKQPLDTPLGQVFLTERQQLALALEESRRAAQFAKVPTTAPSPSDSEEDILQQCNVSGSNSGSDSPAGPAAAKVKFSRLGPVAKRLSFGAGNAGDIKLEYPAEDSHASRGCQTSEREDDSLERIDSHKTSTSGHSNQNSAFISQHPKASLPLYKARRPETSENSKDSGTTSLKTQDHVAADISDAEGRGAKHVARKRIQVIVGDGSESESEAVFVGSAQVHCNKLCKAHDVSSLHSGDGKQAASVCLPASQPGTADDLKAPLGHESADDEIDITSPRTQRLAARQALLFTRATREPCSEHESMPMTPSRQVAKKRKLSCDAAGDTSPTAGSLEALECNAAGGGRSDSFKSVKLEKSHSDKGSKIVVKGSQERALPPVCTFAELVEADLFAEAKHGEAKTPAPKTPGNSLRVRVPSAKPSDQPLTSPRRNFCAAPSPTASVAFSHAPAPAALPDMALPDGLQPAQSAPHAVAVRQASTPAIQQSHQCVGTVAGMPLAANVLRSSAELEQRDGMADTPPESESGAGLSEDIAFPPKPSKRRRGGRSSRASQPGDSSAPPKRRSGRVAALEAAASTALDDDAVPAEVWAPTEAARAPRSRGRQRARWGSDSALASPRAVRRLRSMQGEDWESDGDLPLDAARLGKRQKPSALLAACARLVADDDAALGATNAAPAAPPADCLASVHAAIAAQTQRHSVEGCRLEQSMTSASNSVRAGSAKAWQPTCGTLPGNSSAVLTACNLLMAQLRKSSNAWAPRFSMARLDSLQSSGAFAPPLSRSACRAFESSWEVLLTRQALERQAVEKYRGWLCRSAANHQ